MKTAAITETAFSCLHCDAYTTQNWFAVMTSPIKTDDRVPFIPDQKFIEHIKTSPETKREDKDKIISWAQQMLTGYPFGENTACQSNSHTAVLNLFLSKCFNCGKYSIWVHDKPIYPPKLNAAPPNKDLPDEVRKDFEEARSIFDASPRGAAALLRLSIQKLCKHLGEKGRKIDDDIASLVKKGLSPMVQQSLDIVRVIGNEAVHPGTIDLNDDRGTATQLFGLVNIIAQQMISDPKVVKSLYDSLPKDKRDAIEKRDKK